MQRLKEKVKLEFGGFNLKNFLTKKEEFFYDELEFYY